MIKLYKEGKICNAEVHQIPFMEKGGWSKTPPDGKDPVPDAQVDKEVAEQKAKVQRAANQKAAIAQGKKASHKGN